MKILKSYLRDVKLTFYTIFQVAKSLDFHNVNESFGLVFGNSGIFFAMLIRPNLLVHVYLKQKRDLQRFHVNEVMLLLIH